MNKYDVVIVGAGMAGLTAAIYTSRAGLSTLVLEAGAVGGQIVSSTAVDNWPGDLGVSGADLMEKIYHQANKLGAKLEYAEVLSVEDKGAGTDRERFVVKTDDGEYACGAIILAMGTMPRPLSKKQLEDAGDRPVSYCATCDGALYKGKPVVVIGSGNTAKHEISYLEGLASKVYHIHHDDPIPKDAEAVFVATKRVPGTGFVSGLVELDGDGYVVADEDCETSRAGVFVAGDCRTKHVRQLVTAAGDGAIAAGAVVSYLSSKDGGKNDKN